MRHELDDDTVRLLHPVNAGEVEVDDEFEREFASLVLSTGPAIQPSALQVRMLPSPANLSLQLNIAKDVFFHDAGSGICLLTYAYSCTESDILAGELSTSQMT